MPKTKKKNQILAVLAAACMGFPLGVSLGWTSPVKDDLELGRLHFNISEIEFYWVSAALPLGATLTCFPTGFLVDLMGSQMILFVSIIPQAIGWILIGKALNAWCVYAGRFLLGIVCAVLFITIPLYISEISPKENRGSMGILFQLFTDGGILFVYIIGAFMNAYFTTMWCLVLPLFLSMGPICLPSSPQFLLMKNRESEAKKNLAALRGSKYDITADLEEMKNEIRVVKEAKKTIGAQMKTRSCLKAILISSSLMAFQSMSGRFPVLFYQTEILQSTKIMITPEYGSIVVAVVQFVSKLSIIFVTEKMGRRIWLIISTITVGLSNFLLGLYLHSYKKNSLWAGLTWMPLISSSLFSAMFSIGFGTIPSILNGEIFPLAIKGVASSIPLTVFWAVNSLTILVLAHFEHNNKLGMMFLLFALMSFFAALFVYFFVPETKGKTFSEIEELLNEDIHGIRTIR